MKAVDDGSTLYKPAPLTGVSTLYTAVKNKPYTKSPEPSNTDSTTSISSSSKSTKKISDDEWIIDYSELTLGKELGSGAFGIVYKGEWRGNDVAIKNLTTANEKELQQFEEEFRVMRGLRPHRNIVQVMGVCTSPLAIVTAFVAGGSLYDLINSDEKINDQLQYKILKGITAGMMHLEAEKIVHRDLAARNVLLTADKEAVISDFGMSRSLGNESAKKTRSDTGPLKWMAPESTSKQEYSSKSDVWAWGITIWELLSRLEPYPDMDSVQAVLAVKDGLRPTIPQGTREGLATLLKQCWSLSPQERPTFVQIHAVLNNVYSDMK